MASFTAFRTWVAGEVVTAALLNAQLRDNGIILKTSIADDGTLAGILFSRTTSDFVKNENTTLGDVTGLSFAIGANEVWMLRIIAILTSHTNADIKYDITVPSGAVGRWGVMRNALTLEATIGTPITGMATQGVDEHMIIHALVVNSTTPGSVQLQAAQNASHASNTTIYTHSHILATKVG